MNNMDNSILEIVVRNNVEVVDSRLIAIELNISHAQFYRTIKDNQTDIESVFGRVCFSHETLNTAGGMQQVKFAYLTEDQATYLMTLCRNTPEVKKLKLKLVKSFSESKKRIKSSVTNASELEYQLSLKDKEIEILKLNLELESYKVSLAETTKLVKENQSLIKQSMECISLQDEKNFENGYYLQRLVEITDEHPFVKKVLDLKWAIKSTGYTFSHLSYTIRDLLKLFGVGDLNIRVVARNVSNVFQVEKKKLPSEKKETYKYTGEDLIYPVAVIACLRELNWEDLRDALEIDYKIKFPSSNRKFFPKNNN